MGMDRLGEIHDLVDIVKPQIGIITNIGLSHIEKLGSRENIRKAKLEITDFFQEKDLLVIEMQTMICFLQSRAKVGIAFVLRVKMRRLNYGFSTRKKKVKTASRFN